MSKNKSNSMKVFFPNKQTKKATSDLLKLNNKRERLMKLRYHGKIIHVPYDEFLSLRKMNREKMKALKDSLIQIIKTKKEIYVQQNSYDIESLKKISVERENEFRDIIFEIQKDIRKEKNIYSKDMYDFYKHVISMVKTIYETANKEIEDKINTINSHININLANCDYKQEKLLEKKIKENEEYFRYIHNSTFQMKKVMDNFDAINHKIFEFQEINYNYKKRLLKEKIRNEYIKHLMTKAKIKMNEMNNSINEFINKNPLNTISNLSNIPKFNKFSTFSASRKNIKKNIPNNLKNFSTTQKQLKINYSSTKKNNLVITIESPNTRMKRRPFSSGQRLKTYEKIGNSTKRTNYSNSNTLQSNFRVSSSKGRPTNSYKNLFDIKNKIFKNDVNSIILKTNQNSNFFSLETEENKKNSQSEWNSLYLIKKEINNIKNKQKDILNKMEDEMPDNDIYESLKNIILKLRKEKDNKIVNGINNKYMKSYMKAIPIQDANFRKKFMEILFNDNNIYQSIKKVTNESKNILFNKNIFGAEKIYKDY